MNTPADSLIALHDIGVVGYSSGRNILDLVGLTNVEVSKYYLDRSSKEPLPIKERKIIDYLKEKKLHDVLPEHIADRFITTIHKAIDNDAMQIIEYELHSIDMKLNPKDGPKGPQWYEGRVFPFKLPPGDETYVIWTAINITEKKKAELELKKALEEIKTLRGILPICSHCKKIRDDEGYWHNVDVYVRDHSDADFSHGICPDCMKELYPWFEGGEQ